MMYTLILIIHVLCAIIFLGFVFTDVVILPVIAKKLGREQYELFMETIIKRGVKIFPPVVLLLVLSGGYMFTQYINQDAGMFNSALQIWLLIKVFLVVLIIAGVIYSLYCKFKQKSPLKFMEAFHTYVLILGFFIVIIAKIMFIA